MEHRTRDQPVVFALVVILSGVLALATPPFADEGGQRPRGPTTTTLGMCIWAELGGLGFGARQGCNEELRLTHVRSTTSARGQGCCSHCPSRQASCPTLRAPLTCPSTRLDRAEGLEAALHGLRLVGGRPGAATQR